MLPVPSYVKMDIAEITPEDARSIVKLAKMQHVEIISAVGHESTAKMLSELLGFEVPVNRTMVKLNTGDTAIIFQLFTRLPEGRVLNKSELEELMKKGLAKLLRLHVVDVLT